MPFCFWIKVWDGAFYDGTAARTDGMAIYWWSLTEKLTDGDAIYRDLLDYGT